MEEDNYMVEWTTKQLQDFCSSWNGDEQWFIFENEKYHVNDIGIAEEILESRGESVC